MHGYNELNMERWHGIGKGQKMTYEGNRWGGQDKNTWIHVLTWLTEQLLAPLVSYSYLIWKRESQRVIPTHAQAVSILTLLCEVPYIIENKWSPTYICTQCSLLCFMHMHFFRSQQYIYRKCSHIPPYPTYPHSWHCPW